MTTTYQLQDDLRQAQASLRNQIIDVLGFLALLAIIAWIGESWAPLAFWLLLWSTTGGRDTP